jgi:hypothetical protein
LGSKLRCTSCSSGSGAATTAAAAADKRDDMGRPGACESGHRCRQHCSRCYWQHSVANSWLGAGGRASERTSINFSRQAARCCCRSGIWLATICCFSWP